MNRAAGSAEEVGIEGGLLQAQPSGEAGGTANGERPIPMREVLLEDEQRDPAEVVTVEMRHRDRVDVARIHHPAEGRQRRGAAVEQQRDARRSDVDARVGAAAVGEGVAGAHEGHPQAHDAASAGLCRSVASRARRIRPKPIPNTMPAVA